MKQLIISLIAWFTVINCCGQDVIQQNSLSLNLGPGYMMRQDIMFSPFVHTDISFLSLGLEYTHQAKLYQKVSFRYGNFNPRLSEPYDFSIHGENETAYPHSFNMIDIDYQIGKVIMDNRNSTLTAGGLLSMDIQAFNYVYGRISSFGYYSAFGLDIFGRYGIKINERNSITASLQLPLAAWLARPPYNGIDDEFIENISSHSGLKTFMAFIADGELVTWNRLQTLDAGFAYTYRLNEKWDLGAGYLFEFIHATQPQTLLSFRNSLNISATIRF